MNDKALPADLMTASQASNLLNCSVNTIANLRRKGTIKAYGPRNSLISWTEVQKIWATKGDRARKRQQWFTRANERNRQRQFAIDAQANR